MSLRIVFMGTPEFAVASLDKLIKTGFEISAVVTTADKPSGRGQKVLYSSVKQYAMEKNLHLLQPDKLKDPNFIEQLQKIKADVFVVVAFRMLPEIVWSMPVLGTINLHASLLPKYRGAAPINWAIMNGETETGVTTFLIDKIDTGKILLNTKVAIGPDDNAGELHDRLMTSGAELLVKTIKDLEKGILQPVAQSEHSIGPSQLLPAPKLFKDNCRINWNQESKKIFNFIRGLSPYPSAWTVMKNLKDNQEFIVKIYKSKIMNGTKNEPGTIISDGKIFLNIASDDGFISIQEIQMEGKKKLSIEEFLRGFHGIEGYRFIR